MKNPQRNYKSILKKKMEVSMDKGAKMKKKATVSRVSFTAGMSREARKARIAEMKRWPRWLRGPRWP